MRSLPSPSSVSSACHAPGFSACSFLCSADVSGHDRFAATRQLLPPQAHPGPYAGLVQCLEGLPAALALRGVLDEAWQSPLLPTRAKALVFAVVARGVGCPRSEAEASRLLVAAGMNAAEVEETLAHLGSRSLDALEAMVVPFARETIRYRPVQVQRRARQLAPALAPAQLVELIGITALANAVCRLCLTLDSR